MLGKRGGIAWWMILLCLAIIVFVIISLWMTTSYGQQAGSLKKSIPEEEEPMEIIQFKLHCLSWSAGEDCTMTPPSALTGDEGACDRTVCNPITCLCCCRALGYIE